MSTTNHGKLRSKTGTGQEAPHASIAAQNGKGSLISNEKLIALYTNLLECRAMQGPVGNNGKHASSRNHEAAVVGTAIDLEPGDLLCSRRHGLMTEFSDGSAIRKLLSDPVSHRNGIHPPKTAEPRASTDGTSASASGTHTHAALGTALAYKARNNGKVAVVFWGDEDPTPLREAVEIAAAHSLPVVFVHQGDFKRNGRAANRKPAKKASTEEIPWFPDITVDAHDVVAVYRVAYEAISRARLGRGPTLIECRPFHVHGRPAVSRANRDGRHVHDAVTNMEHYLKTRGLFDPKVKTGTAEILSCS